MTTLSELNARNKRLRAFLWEVAQLAKIPMFKTTEVVLTSKHGSSDLTGAKEARMNLVSYRNSFLKEMDERIERLRAKIDTPSCSAKTRYELAQARAMRSYIWNGSRCS